MTSRQKKYAKKCKFHQRWDTPTRNMFQAGHHTKYNAYVITYDSHKTGAKTKDRYIGIKHKLVYFIE